MNVRLLFRLLALLAAALVSVPAMAAPTHIRAELVPERTSARPGETVMMAFHMRPDPGWHGYWENPGDAGLGLTPEWTLPEGAEVGALRYPVPQTLLIAGLMNHVYERDYALLVPLTLPADAREGATLAIAVDAQWLACTDEICVPEQARLATRIGIAPPAPPDPRFDEWRRRLPAAMAQTARHALEADSLRIAIPLPASTSLLAPHLFLRTEGLIDYAAPQGFSRRGDLLIVELKRAAAGRAPPPREVAGVLSLGENAGGGGLAFRSLPGAVPPRGEALAEGSAALSPANLGTLLGLALIGGLLLNVMPCVFPILSLKALTLAKAGSHADRARRDGFAYTGGVLVACLGLGSLMLLLRAAGEEVGWAFQLQEPLVVAGLLLLAVAMTANLAGLFEIPALWSGGGRRGAFAGGFLAAFVATPCTGPFMAAAMGAALVLPTVAALSVFAALGIGLALPFLALALVPGLRRALPRPGPWMVRFRHAMAVPMGLTALALLWLASRTAGPGFALASAAAGGALLVVLMLIGRDQRSGRAAAPRALPALTALLLIAALALPLTRGEPLAASADGLGSTPFTTEALDNARRGDGPVFLYFTADWCLTCKVNESAAIEREATAAAFARSGVRVLRGDWTRREPAMTRFLAQHGAAGVPLYLWYRPGSAEPEVLPQLLTSSMLVDLSEQSRRKS